MTKYTLSYTQKQVRKQCERKWYLQYEKGIEDTKPKSEALVFGEFVHLILAQYMREYYQDFSSEQLDGWNLSSIRVEAWHSLSSKEALSKIPSHVVEGEAHRLVLKALQVLQKDYQEIYLFDNKPAIEVELTIDNFYTGIIDLVYIDKRGKVILLDWKTTSSLYTNHQVKQSEQLKGYAWLLAQHSVIVDRVAYGVLHKKNKTAKIMKVRNDQNYRGFVKGIKKVKLDNEHYLRLHRGKSILTSFPKNQDSCFAYRSECQFYDQCWGEDKREVEVIQREVVS